MTQYEKVIEHKDIIKKLYVKEGRSISYIADLLDVQRISVSKLIKEEQWEQGNKYYLKPSSQKWINKNKDKIISLIYQGLSDLAISKELHCTYEMIHNTCMRGCLEIKQAREKYSQMREEEILTTFHEDEVWKPLLGYEDYKISNYGRLMSYKGATPIEIAPGRDGEGRYTFILNIDGKSKNFKRARVVAHTFCKNDNPQINTTVDHINGDYTDDRASNLEWVSQSENNKRSYKNGRTKNKNHNTHNRKEIFIVDGKYEFKTIASLARFIKKSETQTRRIVNGQVKNPSRHIEVKYRV